MMLFFRRAFRQTTPLLLASTRADEKGEEALFPKSAFFHHQQAPLPYLTKILVYQSRRRALYLLSPLVSPSLIPPPPTSAYSPPSEPAPARGIMSEQQGREIDLTQLPIEQLTNLKTQHEQVGGRARSICLPRSFPAPTPTPPPINKCCCCICATTHTTIFLHRCRGAPRLAPPPPSPGNGRAVAELEDPEGGGEPIPNHEGGAGRAREKRR